MEEIAELLRKTEPEQAQAHKNILLSIGAIIYICLFNFKLINIPIDNFLFPLLFLFSFETETHLIQCSKFHQKNRSPYYNFVESVFFRTSVYDVNAPICNIGPSKNVTKCYRYRKG